MRYRFRKMIERPDWATPYCVCLEIEYEIEPAPPVWDDEVGPGGLTDWFWTVARLHSPVGQTHTPEAFTEAERLLEAEPDFEQEVLDWCREDYAQREAMPWPDREI
jgi:hypothetical protein